MNAHNEIPFASVSSASSCSIPKYTIRPVALSHEGIDLATFSNINNGMFVSGGTRSLFGAFAIATGFTFNFINNAKLYTLLIRVSEGRGTPADNRAITIIYAFQPLLVWFVHVLVVCCGLWAGTKYWPAGIVFATCAELGGSIAFSLLPGQALGVARDWAKHDAKIFLDPTIHSFNGGAPDWCKVTGEVHAVTTATA